MKYVMDLNQFTFLKEQATKHEEIVAFEQANATDGVITTNDVKLTYHYDGMALQYTRVHNFTLAAKIASDGFLEKHVDEIIMEVLATEPQVTADTAKENK